MSASASSAITEPSKSSGISLFDVKVENVDPPIFSGPVASVALGVLLRDGVLTRVFVLVDVVCGRSPCRRIGGACARRSTARRSLGKSCSTGPFGTLFWLARVGLLRDVFRSQLFVTMSFLAR